MVTKIMDNFHHQINKHTSVIEKANILRGCVEKVRLLGLNAFNIAQSISIVVLYGVCAVTSVGAPTEPHT